MNDNFSVDKFLNVCLEVSLQIQDIIPIWSCHYIRQTQPSVKYVIRILKTQHPTLLPRRSTNSKTPQRSNIGGGVLWARKDTDENRSPPLIIISCRRDWFPLTSVSKSPHLRGVNVFCLGPVESQSASTRWGNEFPTRMAFGWSQMTISRPRMSLNVFSPANGTSMFINVKCIMIVVYLVVITRRLKWVKISKGIRGYSSPLESLRANLF